VIGVWFGRNDKRNVIKPFTDRIQTKNRAELKAVVQGLAIVRDAENVSIKTHSEYVVQNVKTELENWKRQGWRLKRGNQNRVSNFDLWEQLYDMLHSSPQHVTWTLLRPKSMDVKDLQATATLIEKSSALIKDSTVVQTDVAYPVEDDVGLIPAYGVWFGHGDHRNRVALCSDTQSPSKIRCELRAAIMALRATEGESQVTIRTKSEEILRYIYELEGWKKNDWKLKNGNPVYNADLWKELDALLQNEDQAVLWRPASSQTIMPFIMQDIYARGHPVKVTRPQEPAIVG